jgi:uncharacterized UBP type Zn finger protein
MSTSGTPEPVCSHLDQVHPVTPSSMEGCSECLASGSRWVHLRLCLSCGQVGCCDSSPNRHASKHAAAHQHPVVASFEPGEDWSWCYVDEAAFVLPDLELPHRRPYPGEAPPAG